MYPAKGKKQPVDKKSAKSQDAPERERNQQRKAPSLMRK